MRQTSAIPTDKAGVGTNPKSAVWGAEQPGDCSARQVLTRRRLPGDAAIAVESKQAEFRAKPKITIRRLGNGVDITFEETLAYSAMPCGRIDQCREPDLKRERIGRKETRCQVR